MNDNKKYTSFKIAFGILLLFTVILFIFNKNKTNAIISGAATAAVGLIYLYFKISDILTARRKKARRMHLDK